VEITVEGSVQGALKASDRVRLGPASSVQGSVMTPRIAIEDGARLRGKVEMIRAGEVAAPAAKTAAVVAAPAVEKPTTPTNVANAATASTTNTTPAAGATEKANAARVSGD
jgi:cytoskeletal protein CcmA (bactofilin family)